MTSTENTSTTTTTIATSGKFSKVEDIHDENLLREMVSYLHFFTFSFYFFQCKKEIHVVSLYNPTFMMMISVVSLSCRLTFHIIWHLNIEFYMLSLTQQRYISKNANFPCQLSQLQQSQVARNENTYILVFLVCSAQ